MVYWNTAELKKKKGLWSGKEPTSFACVTADDTGLCYAGATNSLIYVYSGNACKKAVGFHDKGFVGAINWVDGKLYTGGRDGKVCIIDPAAMECISAIEFGMLPRALDVKDGNLIVGLMNGSIVQCNLDSLE